MKKMILASTSTMYNEGYLEYLLPELKVLFENCKKIIFIPYAKPNGISFNDYTNKVQDVFSKIDITVNGIHEFESAIDAIKNAEGIFTGGGNTFLLVAQLYQYNLMDVLKQAVLNGTPYLGTSAGSNIAGLTMNNTNDMPIVLPKSFETLGLIPFNLNPHFLDADKQSKHMGETRETRIKEFHTVSNIPVLGLREGSWLEIKNNNIVLKGNLSARLFMKDAEAKELEAGSILTKF
jgi:dipeptidase E